MKINKLGKVVTIVGLAVSSYKVGSMFGRHKNRMVWMDINSVISERLRSSIHTNNVLTNDNKFMRGDILNKHMEFMRRGDEIDKLKEKIAELERDCVTLIEK